MITAQQALNMLALTTMRFFDRDDWHAFAGCESRSPMIGEFGDEYVGRYTLVVDGAVLLVLGEHDETGGIMFNLSLT
jgi:hypothetical protein